MNSSLPILKIDDEFRTLIRPLHQKEYLQLEENLLEDGCREPIATWNGYIIDGHNRYSICTKHDIPFDTIDMEFESREDVIAWICKNQLGRRNITEETRKYLIGKQYNAEKTANQMKNLKGANQYSDDIDYIPDEEPVKEISNNKTAKRIAEENSITHATVQKYSAYANALNTIQRKEPDIVSGILAGKYKISHKNLLNLAKMPKEEVKEINDRMGQTNIPYMRYSKTRNILKETAPVGISIKDMPAYDPDARFTELTLTIPSWGNTIERTRSNSNIQEVTADAKTKLEFELVKLQKTIHDMLCFIEEN